MIKLLVVYPAVPGSRFDFDYYAHVHMPLATRLLEPHGFLGYEILRCAGTVRGDAPQFRCITELRFATLDGLREGMGAHGAELSADFAAYTDITPVATVCEPLHTD